MYLSKKNTEIASYITILVYAALSTCHTHNLPVFIGFTIDIGTIRTISSNFSKKITIV